MSRVAVFPPREEIGEVGKAEGPENQLPAFYLHLFCRSKAFFIIIVFTSGETVMIDIVYDGNIILLHVTSMRN